MNEPKNIISLGAGVQSTTMALMAARGELLPMPDAAVFADTGDEPQEVYRHLEWLTSLLPFPVVKAMRSKLSTAMITGDNAARMPFYIKNGGTKTRQCTRGFKIRPIRAAVRTILGVGNRAHIPPGTVSQWIGISTDEADRMKPSGCRFVVNRWPLIEIGMNRIRADKWLWDYYGRHAPKSACKQCPYQEPERLLHLQTTSPSEFAELVEFDEGLRTPENVRRFHGEIFLTSARIPLVQIDLAGIVADRLDRKTRQKTLFPDEFTNECEGMCGL